MDFASWLVEWDLAGFDSASVTDLADFADFAGLALFLD